MVHFLLSSGAHTCYCLSKPLHKAIGYCCDLEIPQLLLDFNASVNVVDYHGMTTLHWASMREDFFVTWLIKNGADVNAVNKNGRTPLRIAVYEQNVSCVKALLESNTDTEIEDQCFKTPLYIACDRYESTNEMVAII